jgi:hypothetical protein
MQQVTRLCSVVGSLLFSALFVHAQSGVDRARDQEDFAIAVARAHASTSLFGAGSQPVAIQVKALSSLALHGTGTGTYEYKWADAQHWQRELQFPDFQQSEMKNDTGHPWLERSTKAMPIRIAQLVHYAVLHVPSSTAAAAYTVSESATSGEKGEPLTCFAATQPAPGDGFPRQYRWCFENATGLLVSEDIPLSLHITYSNYIAFQGRQEYTHVHVAAGSFPALDLDLQYAPLDPHALDGLEPTPTMQRTGSSASAANPEEWGKGTVEYRYSPPLPAGTPDAQKNDAAHVHFQIGADNTVEDASLEDAPTQAMAEAAIQAAAKFKFIPATLDGKRVKNQFFYSIWFHDETTEASAEASETQPRDQDKPGNLAPVLDPGPVSIYRSQLPSFAFRYPSDFEQIPLGQLKEDQQHAKNKSYGLEPHAQCDTLLFKAQRYRKESRTSDFVTITDYDGACFFGLLDQRALESSAVNTARSAVAKWADSKVSQPGMYKVNDRTFATISASGTPPGVTVQPLNVLVVLTKIHEHIVIWKIQGPEGPLEQILAACSLQIGDDNASSFFPPHE